MRLILFGSILLSLTINAQSNNVDSLRAIWLDVSQNDTVRLEAVNKIASKIYQITKPDSAIIYARQQYDFAKQKNLPKYMSYGLNTQGISYSIKRDFNEALKYFTESLEVSEGVDDWFGIATALNNLGNVYLQLRESSKALFYLEKCIPFYEKSGRATQILTPLTSLGVLNQHLGEYEKSIGFLNQSLAICESTGNLRSMISCLSNLGMTHMFMGEFTTAIDFVKRSSATCQQTGNLPGLMHNHMLMGNFYSHIGDFSSAMNYHYSAMKYADEINDQGSVAVCLANIGGAFIHQGYMEKGIEFMQKALKIQEEISDKPGMAVCLSDIGSYYLINKNYTLSQEFYLKSLKVSDEIQDQRNIASALTNLGNLNRLLGNFIAAEEYNEKGLNIYREINDKAGIATAMNHVCETCLEQGKLTGALAACQNSRAVAAEIGDASENRYATQLLCNIYLKLDSIDIASGYTQQILSFLHGDIKINFSTLSELQKEKYFTTLEEEFDLLYDFAFHFPERENQTAIAYSNSLLTKGLLLKSSTTMRNAILSSGDSLLIEEYNHWLVLKRRIARIYSEGGEIKMFEEQANDLENELVKKSGEFADMAKALELSWRGVQSHLIEGESAIEFIRFNSQPDYNNESPKEKIYCALIINNDSERPEMIRLFTEPELEKIIGTFPGNNLSYINQVYGSKENTKSQLYDLIWKPMEKSLQGVTKIYISPVGLLHKISFSALAKEQDVFLCDVYELETQSSTGNIAMATSTHFDPAQGKPLSGQTSLSEFQTTIFGGIDYNSDSTSSEIWNYLDGSLTETQKIEKILKKNNESVNYYNLGSATEEQFKQTASESNILHIATHGFFYADPDEVLAETVDETESSADINFRGGTSGFGVQSFVKSRNPLMRSGLVFAGANDVWNRITATDDFESTDTTYREDGVLTAQEVATIDMRKTELVVLSACETGLGDIKGSEGVYGLQRAFKMAGVKYIIMSLWQVPDKETAEFMTTFYKNLTKTNDIRKSFNLTQRTMREKYDPYYWGAFVLIE